MVMTNVKEQIGQLQDGNRIIGEIPELINSKIVFRGKGNVVICEKSVRIENSTITFNGNGSIVYLCQSVHNYRLSASLHHDMVLYIGKNNYFNGPLNIVLSEQKHCFIGNDCIFSFGIWIRNADPHLVYSSKTGQRINLSKSVFIGDHVWIGQSALLLKGTRIDSGSIIGAASIVAGKKVPHNESWAGNPCRKITDSVFWNGACVHMWREKDTQCSMDYCQYVKQRNVSPEEFRFAYEPDKSISFEEIDKLLSKWDVDEKIAYLNRLSSEENKNRFVHQISSKKKFLFF